MNKDFATYMESCCRFVGEILPLKLSEFWKSINSFIDLGGGSGYITLQICKHHKHLKGINSDLKHLEPVFKEYLEKESDSSLKERVKFLTLDFFKDPFPTDVDAFMFGNTIHDWEDKLKIELIRKSFDSLP